MELQTLDDFVDEEGGRESIATVDSGQDLWQSRSIMLDSSLHEPKFKGKASRGSSSGGKARSSVSRPTMSKIAFGVTKTIKWDPDSESAAWYLERCHDIVQLNQFAGFGIEREYEIWMNRRTRRTSRFLLGLGVGAGAIDLMAGDQLHGMMGPPEFATCMVAAALLMLFSLAALVFNYRSSYFFNYRQPVILVSSVVILKHLAFESEPADPITELSLLRMRLITEIPRRRGGSGWAHVARRRGGGGA
jgi:hypothetical protein